MKARFARSWAILMAMLMILSVLAAFAPAVTATGEAPRATGSRADTETANDDINGADTLTSGVPNAATLLISSANDVIDWFRIDCSRGQAINVSLYHQDWNPADPGQYNLQIVLYGPEGEGSLNYVPYWFSFLQVRWETASGLCAFSAPYFIYVQVNATDDNPPQVATDPVHYTIDATAYTPPSLSGGQQDQKVLSTDSPNWFQWYKIGSNYDQSFNARLQNPNGANIDMDMFGLWDRGYNTADIYQGYQPFFLNQTRAQQTNGNVEQMAGRKGDMDVYVRLWLREGAATGQYTFQVQNALLESDGNNVPTDAEEFTKSTSAQYHGHQAVDHFDWYKFSIDAGFTVDIQFNLVNVRTSYWNLTIWDESLDYVEGYFNTQDGHPYVPPSQGDPGNPVSNMGISLVDWDPPSPGTYYIMIMSIAGDPAAHMREPPLADQLYRLSVTLPNYGPTIKSTIPDATINEDESFSGLDLMDYFEDPEGDPLTYNVMDDSNYVVTNKVGASNVTATPSANWYGTCNITVQATDGTANIGENTVSQTFTLTVLSVNDDPYVKEPMTNFTMYEGDTDKFTMPKDLDSVFGDIDSPLTYSWSGNSRIQVRKVPGTTEILFSAPDLWFGEENITFTASDGGTNPAKNTVRVTVKHKNHVPTLAFGKKTYEIEMDEDDEADMSLNAEDMFEDIDTTYAGDSLFYRLREPLPLNVNVTLLEDNTIFIKPFANWSGDAEFKVYCEDEWGVQNETTVYITVEPVNDPPTIKQYSPTNAEITINENSSQVFIVTQVDDIDNDPINEIRYTWYVDNVEQTDDNVKHRQFTFRTTFLEEDGYAEGTYVIKCVVTDGELETEMEWKVTVNDLNQKPTGARIVSPNAVDKYKVGKPVLFEADANASDPDGDPLYYKWVHNATGTVLSEEEAFTFDWKDKELKKVLKPGKHKIELFISDGRGGETRTAVTITVKAKEPATSPGFEAVFLLAAVLFAVLAIGHRRRRT